MASGKARKRARQAAPASGGRDRISALPDKILRRVLSFIPAQQVVQTCVLARRWRHLWKSATSLRIVGADGKAPVPYEEFWLFVDSLLLLRGSSPLEIFELRVDGPDIDVRCVRLWVSYAVKCRVQELLLSFHGNTHASLSLCPEDPPLASMHLTKLQLCGVAFNGDFLDFSRCPELKHLQIHECSFEHAERISSQSLRHLSITGGKFNQSFRARILAPNLASLQLHVIAGRTPVLEKMPFLVKSIVGIWGYYRDICSHSNCGDCGDESCEGCIRDDSASVILHGMSQAKSLMLRAYHGKFIFRRDLKLCPTFNQLKFLSLNENWCVPDEYPLAYILEHSPVLEGLILHLYSQMGQVSMGMKGKFNPKELPPTISSHLKRVQIICGCVDGTVLKALKFLSKLNISFSFE